MIDSVEESFDSGRKWTDDDIKFFVEGKIDNLKKISLSYQSFTDVGGMEFVKLIKKAKNLETINVIGGKFSDETLNALLESVEENINIRAPSLCFVSDAFSSLKASTPMQKQVYDRCEQLQKERRRKKLKNEEENKIVQTEEEGDEFEEEYEEE